MFPITDFRGRVIAFGGRALQPDVPAKYLNSPETELFHKRLTLYNGQGARKAAHDGRPVVVVEGYLDVIAAVAAGFEGTVAPLGTALTEDHLQLLWRMSDMPVLCFDGDEAGQRAAERAVEMVLPLLAAGQDGADRPRCPKGQDPDDLIRPQGRAAFARADRRRARRCRKWSGRSKRAAWCRRRPEARAALEARLRERANAIRDTIGPPPLHAGVRGKAQRVVPAAMARRGAVRRRRAGAAGAATARLWRGAAGAAAPQARWSRRPCAIRGC